MAVYLFKCRAGSCLPTSTTTQDAVPDCPHGYQRDYRGESVGIGSGVRVSRDGTTLDQARLFLPSNDDFKGPGDPDGQVGARNWLDTHQPKEASGGNNPLLSPEKRSF